MIRWPVQCLFPSSPTKKVTNIYSRTSKMIGKSFHSLILRHRLSLASNMLATNVLFYKPYIIYVYNNSSLAFSCPDVIYSLSYLATVSRLEAVPSSFMLNLRVRVGAQHLRGSVQLLQTGGDVYRQLPAFPKKKANRLKVPKSLLLLQFSAVPKHIDPI